LGTDWIKAAEEAPRTTRALIVIETPGALDSEPVLKEVEAFRKRQRPIFPIDIGETLARSPSFKLVHKQRFA
jgi:hypothetical protein